MYQSLKKGALSPEDVEKSWDIDYKSLVKALLQSRTSFCSFTGSCQEGEVCCVCCIMQT